ncbi:MAG: class B sortase [Clostridia bacterium]|nr:class B sortase [Clostridia bacterium]
MEKNNKNKGFLIVIMILLIGVIAFCAYKLLDIGKGYLDDRKAYTEIVKISKIDEGEDVDFKALEKTNDGVKAWIYSPKTIINYPVVKGEDNDYYLNHNFSKDSAACGALFIDKDNNGDFQDFLTIIYGHRMRDGSMFASLGNYLKQDYYDKHNYMVLRTKSKAYKLELFAGNIIEGHSEYYDLSRYTNNEVKEAFIKEIVDNSSFKSDVSVGVNDRIVCLSTCTYEIDNGRYVLFGKLSELDEPEYKEVIRYEEPSLTESVSDEVLWILVGACAVVLLLLVILIRAMVKKRSRK